jgi:chemotaxis protein CheX
MTLRRVDTIAGRPNGMPAMKALGDQAKTGGDKLCDVLKLPAKMDVTGARAFCETLLAKRGSPVQIDASSVEKAGALAIEVLLSGARQWAEDGLSFHIVAVSEAFSETCAGLGFDPEMFPESEAQKMQGAQ